MNTERSRRNSKRELSSPLDKTRIFLLGIGATVVGLLFGTFLGGPLVRAVVGVPAGFHEDFTSFAAYRQALIVQVISLGLVFLVVGAFLSLKMRYERLIWLWMANPITVGLGFLIYRAIYRSLSPIYRLDEYYGVKDGVLLTIAALFFFTLWSGFGTYVSKRGVQQI
jgi:hypothetical protein